MATKPATTTDNLARNIGMRTAKAWRPVPGETVTAALAGVRLGTSEYPKPTGSTYPILILEKADGTFVAMHAFHKMAQDELKEMKPTLGHVLTIHFPGKVVRTDDEKTAGKNDYVPWIFIKGDGSDEVIAPEEFIW